jgi:hypothetical protein
MAAECLDVFTVVDRGENEKPFYLKIGRMWLNKDGNGWTGEIQALPTNGKLGMYPPKEREDQGGSRGGGYRGGGGNRGGGYGGGGPPR